MKKGEVQPNDWSENFNPNPNMAALAKMASEEAPKQRWSIIDVYGEGHDDIDAPLSEDEWSRADDRYKRSKEDY